MPVPGLEASQQAAQGGANGGAQGGFPRFAGVHLAQALVALAADAASSLLLRTGVQPSESPERAPT